MAGSNRSSSSAASRCFERALDDLLTRAAAVGLAGRAAIGPTWGAAFAFARYLAQPTFIAKDIQPLLALPLLALRLSAEEIEGLDQLGVRSVGELNALPRAPLARRFGTGLLRRLDQAFGRAGEPIDPVTLPEIVSQRRAFAEPIGAPETLARYVGQLCINASRWDCSLEPTGKKR